jgi:hypothetical protein
MGGDATIEGWDGIGDEGTQSGIGSEDIRPRGDKLPKA